MEEHREQESTNVVQIYDRLHAKLESKSAATSTSAWFQLADKHLGSVSGLRVLEIGCGRGEFARHLADRGASVVAADFSPVAVAITRGRLADYERAEALVADIQSIPFPDETFDLVVSLETLEHVPSPRQGLGELVRVTRRGGRLIITTPNYLNFHGLYRVYLKVLGRRFAEAGDQPINQPLLLFQRVRQLRRLGCRLDAVDGVGHFLPVPGIGSVQARWLRRPHGIMKWFALESLTAATRL